MLYFHLDHFCRNVYLRLVTYKQEYVDSRNQCVQLGQLHYMLDEALVLNDCVLHY